jgi:hypothetical protein
VQNGNVTLEGVVINQADKEVAGLRANGVFGVFKVTNDLQVANQQSEHNYLMYSITASISSRDGGFFIFSQWQRTLPRAIFIFCSF